MLPGLSMCVKTLAMVTFARRGGPAQPKRWRRAKDTTVVERIPVSIAF